MTKKHNAVFDDVLSGLVDPTQTADRASDRGSKRLLKRRTALGEKISGEVQEKTLRFVDPATCRMWDRHNRDYGLLNEDNCADLIDGLKAQGQQEFAAIVRSIDGPQEYEVICGARRHWAISWLRENNYPQFKYLIEVRDLTDEEAFRLADIENRDREDISDYERAVDYAQAIKLYYGGRQKAMAERLEVSEAWLSRYLNLSRLPEQVVRAFADKTQIRELHARNLKPLLADPKQRPLLIACADRLANSQHEARGGQGAPIEPQKVVAALKASVAAPRSKRAQSKVYTGSAGNIAIKATRKGRSIILELPDTITKTEAAQAFEAFLLENLD